MEQLRMIFCTGLINRGFDVDETAELWSEMRKRMKKAGLRIKDGSARACVVEFLNQIDKQKNSKN